jgi:hypothetical protein
MVRPYWVRHSSRGSVGPPPLPGVTTVVTDLFVDISPRAAIVRLELLKHRATEDNRNFIL